MGAQEGQFLLVRATEIRRDASRQIGGIETDEDGASLCRIVGQMPQHLEGAAAHRAEMRRDHAHAHALRRGETEPFPQRCRGPVPADGLQSLQGRCGSGRQESDHGVFGIRMAQGTDRVEERTWHGSRGKNPCDRVPDRQLPRSLSGQGDQQREPPRPARIVGVRIKQYAEHHVSAGEQDRGDVVGRDRVIGQRQADDGGDVGAVREVPAPVEPAQACHRRPAEQQRIPCGDGRQCADVTAVRQVTEQFHPAPTKVRRQIRIADDLPEQTEVPVMGGSHDCGIGHLGPCDHRVGSEKGRQASRRQGIQRRPRLGEFGQYGGDDGCAVDTEQADRVLAHPCGSQQTGVQPLSGQPQRRGLQHRVGAVRQLVHELPGPVCAGDGQFPHGLVQQFAPRLLPEHRRFVQKLGAQPGDLHPRRQLGRTP